MWSSLGAGNELIIATSLQALWRLNMTFLGLHHLIGGLKRPCFFSSKILVLPMPEIKESSLTVIWKSNMWISGMFDRNRFNATGLQLARPSKRQFFTNADEFAPCDALRVPHSCHPCKWGLNDNLRGILYQTVVLAKFKINPQEIPLRFWINNAYLNVAIADTNCLPTF